MINESTTYASGLNKSTKADGKNIIDGNINNYEN